VITGKLPDRPAPAAPAGNGPPKGEDPVALVAKLSQLPRPVSAPHVLRAKGVEVGTVVFHVLSSGELLSVKANAHKATIALLGPDSKGSVAYEEVYDDQRALGTIHLATRQPDSPEFPVFQTLAEVRENLTDDEAGIVLSAYSIFRKEIGPVISELTPDEMEAWIEVLERGVSRFPLSRFTGEALMDLLMYAVRTRKRDSSTVTTSSGPAAGEPSTPSSETDRSE